MTKALRFRLAALIFAVPVMFASAFIPAVALAAGGGNLPTAPLDDGAESLQRGAALFVNYCLGCHSARYITFGRISSHGR